MLFASVIELPTRFFIQVRFKMTLNVCMREAIQTEERQGTHHIEALLGAMH